MSEYQQVANMISNYILAGYFTIGAIGYLTLVVVLANRDQKNDLKEKSKKSLEKKL